MIVLCFAILGRLIENCVFMHDHFKRCKADEIASGSEIQPFDGKKNRRKERKKILSTPRAKFANLNELGKQPAA